MSRDRLAAANANRTPGASESYEMNVPSQSSNYQQQQQQQQRSQQSRYNPPDSAYQQQQPSRYENNSTFNPTSNNYTSYPPSNQQQQQPSSRYMNNARNTNQQQAPPPVAPGSNVAAQSYNNSNDLSEGEFYSKISALREQIEAFTQSTNDMKSFQARLMQSVNPDEKTQSQLNQIQQGCRQNINSIKSDLQLLVETFNNGRIQTSRPEQLKSQIQLIKDSFKEKLSTYQSVLNDYSTRQRERMKRQYLIVNPNATEQEIKSALNVDGQQVFQQALMTSQRRGEALDTLNRVEQRYEDLQALQRDVIELSRLFQDLNTMVLEQGEQLNFIRETAVAAREDAKVGDQQLGQAVVSARKARNTRKWIFWLVLIVLIAVGAGIGIKIGVDRAGNGNNNNNAQTTQPAQTANAVIASAAPSTRAI